MKSRILERLRSEDFAVSIGYILPWPALRSLLAGHRDVQAVETALAEGDITETAVSAFVVGLMSQLRRGERFPDDLTLVAIAVALEQRPTAFATDFLRGLASLDLAEMSISGGVARVCLHRRHWLGDNQTSWYDSGFPGTPESTAFVFPVCGDTQPEVPSIAEYQYSEVA